MTFKKDDRSKPRYDLIPPHAELELAHVLTMGAEKYGANNWHQGGPESIQRYIAAAQRHIAAYRRGEELDGESGYQHLAHAVASLMFAMELGRPSVEEMHGDAAEVLEEKSNLLWRLAREGFDVRVHQRKSGDLYGVLHHGEGQSFETSPKECVADALKSLLSGCWEGGDAHTFMSDAIATYERESGEVDRPCRVWSRAEGEFRIDVFKVKNGEFKAALYRHEKTEDERTGSNALTCMEWIRSTAHHQGKTDALRFMTSACESFRKGQ